MARVIQEVVEKADLYDSTNKGGLPQRSEVFLKKPVALYAYLPDYLWLKETQRANHGMRLMGIFHETLDKALAYEALQDAERYMSNNK